MNGVLMAHEQAGHRLLLWGIPRSHRNPFAPGTPFMAIARRGLIHDARSSVATSFARRVMSEVRSLRLMPIGRDNAH